MSCQINKRLCPGGLKNNPNKNLRAIKYVTIHCTGNYSPTASAKGHAEYLYGGSSGSQMSWHYTADKDGIYQSFEDNRACWHAGDGSGDGNMASIGIEICVNEQTGFRQACDNAAWLTAELLRKHGLSIDRVVQHNRWSGKDCPKELRAGNWGVTWNGFLESVKKYLSANLVEPENTVEPEIPADSGEPSQWAKPAWDWAKKNNIIVGGEPKMAATREQVAQMLYAAMR